MNARARRLWARLLLLCAAASLGLSIARALPPEHNRADLKTAPARPPNDARVQELGQLLFSAIAYDEPSRAEAMFFPRDAFLEVKAIKDPGRYWDQLHARYVADVHALHRTLRAPEHAQFERLDLAQRGGWVRVGEEGNRLPYWASRHSVLHYREGEEHRELEVRVLITWDDRWYLIHLSEFHGRGGK